MKAGEKRIFAFTDDCRKDLNQRGSVFLVPN